MSADIDALVSAVREGDPRGLARAITVLENHEPGYRELAGTLHRHTTGAQVIGITGSPGSGKSTLVDKLAASYREDDLRVGVIAVDPSSPYSGGAVLGDRIRMGSAVGDDGMFVRSMSARGRLGGLSSATGDAIKAFDAAGMDRIIVETVGAGQNEIDIVKTSDTVLVLVPPKSGDTVQMLKAGILEIADIFVVNKADLPGADRTVDELLEMIRLAPEADQDEGESWTPAIVETVATDGDGIEELHETIDDHEAFLDRTGHAERRARERYTDEIRTLLRNDIADLVERELEDRGGMDAVVDDVLERRTDPYSVADEVLEPLRRSVEREQQVDD